MKRDYKLFVSRNGYTGISRYLLHPFPLRFFWGSLVIASLLRFFFGHLLPEVVLEMDKIVYNRARDVEPSLVVTASTAYLMLLRSRLA